MFLIRKFEDNTPFITLHCDAMDDDNDQCRFSSDQTINIKDKKKNIRNNHCSFPIDLKETETDYVIYADLPGCTKDNVGIDFDDGERILHIITKPSESSLSTPTEQNSTSSPNIERWLRRERSTIMTGEAERYVELPKDAVAEQANASLVDGVLEVRVPRQLPKRYNIQLR